MLIFGLELGVWCLVVLEGDPDQIDDNCHALGRGLRKGLSNVRSAPDVFQEILTGPTGEHPWCRIALQF